MPVNERDFDVGEVPPTIRATPLVIVTLVVCVHEAPAGGDGKVAIYINDHECIASVCVITCY